MSDRWMASETLARTIFSMRGDLATIEEHQDALAKDDLSDLATISLRLLELVKAHQGRIAA